MPENPPTHVDITLWRKLTRFMRPYRVEVACLAVVAVATAAVDVAFPLVTRAAIDAALSDGTEIRWSPYVLGFLGLTIALALCVWTFIGLAGRIRTHVSHDIRRAGFAKLQELSFSFYDRHSVGWLMARMTSDCERLSNIFAWGALDLVWGTTLMSGIAVVLLIMHFQLALIVLSVIPFLVLVSVFFQKRILKSSRQVRKTNSLLTASYNESIMGIRTTKVLVREEENLQEFGALAGQMYEASVRNALQSAVYLPIVLALGSVATALALAAGGLQLQTGLPASLSMGTLIAFLTYTRQFFQPVQEIAYWFAELQMAQASAERVVGLIEVVPEVRDTAEVTAALKDFKARPRRPGVAPDGHPEIIETIEFDSVGFTYPGGEEVLRGICLRVERGETIALVGPTGAGKTTLVHLLCRFYEPTTGELRLNGVDYRRRSLHWLQSNLAVVLQAPHLFSGTIADNIRYGRLEATEDEITEAARRVEAHGFIDSLEHGYATQVGEGGNRLSTGQKQLVSLARAILAQPQILILDEATSSVDTETERRLQAGMERALEGRTSFVIAHRLSTIRRADRIVVAEGGGIAEQGTHGELLAQRGKYYELYREQSVREALL